MDKMFMHTLAASHRMPSTSTGEWHNSAEHVLKDIQAKPSGRTLQLKLRNILEVGRSTNKSTNFNNAE